MKRRNKAGEIKLKKQNLYMEHIGPAETVRKLLEDFSFDPARSGKCPFILRNFGNDVIFCAAKCLIYMKGNKR
jgi:hypothetical protein